MPYVTHGQPRHSLERGMECRLGTPEFCSAISTPL